MSQSITTEKPSNTPIRSLQAGKVVGPAYLLATKLHAFQDRGEIDYRGSKDLEDIVTLLGGYWKGRTDKKSLFGRYSRTP